MTKPKGKPGIADDTSHLTKKSAKPRRTDVKNAPVSTETEIKISDFMDAFPFYVMLVDEEHHILRVNNAVRSALGVDPAAIIGKYCPSAVHGLEKPIDNCPLEEAAISNLTVEREIFDQTSGRWVRSSVFPTKVSTADGRRIFLHIIADITDRIKAEEKLQISQKQLRELALHLESVREEERTALAREIHDELGQILTGLKMDASWMSKRIPQSEITLLEKAKAMGDMIDEAMETVKRVSAQLRPAVLDYLGIAAAIDWQAKELEKHSEIKFEFKSNPRDISLDRDRSTALFRICQEALTNVVRHADATRVKVTLKQDKQGIVLRIEDNGKGIDEGHRSDPRSFGLVSMKERALYWGGQVEIEGAPGNGTLVLVRIPLTNQGGIQMTRILIADDHPVVRRGLRQTLAEMPDTVIVDEATDGIDALDKVRTGNYDAIILDIAMPGKNGIDVLEQIKYEKPNLPVLMLTMYAEEQLAVRALKIGASGYLTKASAPDELVTAIQKVLSGGKYVSSSLAEHLASILQQPESQLHETLSNREYQIMRLIASGKTATEITGELYLSIKTVSTYRSRILRKMGLKNNVELARYAAKYNLPI